jgi:hypothetical protein
VTNLAITLIQNRADLKSMNVTEIYLNIQTEGKGLPSTAEQTDFPKRLGLTIISCGYRCFSRSTEVCHEGNLLVLAILVVTPALAFSQSPKPNTHSTITGCLTHTSQPDEYRLVDESGFTNIVYSVTVHLDSYVGQSVTLSGDQSATPSTDTGTAQPMPHFKVVKVKPASGACKK